MRKLQFMSIVGLTLFVIVSGCDSKTQQSGDGKTSNNGDKKVQDDGKAKKDHGEEGHAHGAGPHDGTIADWGGGKFHVEFTVDHDKQEATVYILGGDEKTPSPIKAESIELSIKDPQMQVTLMASSQESDPAGTASRFVGNHESLGAIGDGAHARHEHVRIRGMVERCGLLGGLMGNQ